MITENAVSLWGLVLAYLIGSIPSGLILGKLVWHTDLRQYGSKNIGATNAWRVIGKPAGITVFLCDLFKGMLGVLIAGAMAASPLSMILGGIAAIVGHSASVFLKFKGGKGVATGLGVILLLMPKVTVVVFIVWVLITVLTRYVSLASVTGAVLVPILAFVFDYGWMYVTFGILVGGFVVYRHKSNIERLLNGTENKI